MDTPVPTREDYDANTPKPNCRLNGDGVPLSIDKQRWLNIAFGTIRAERDYAKATGNTRLTEMLTNVLSTLILVDCE
jgi:hypothetical protein